MTDKIGSRPDHLESIVDKEGVASPNFNLFLDDLFRAANAIFGQSLVLNTYTVLELQTGTSVQIKAPAVDNKNGMVICSDETGGLVPAFSDGVDWRRVTDRAIIS